MVNLFNLSYENGRGIFEAMHGSADYWDLYRFQSSPTSSDKKPENAFDFDNDTHWIASKASPDTNTSFLSFCFKYFKVQATGYTLTTTALNAAFSGRPKLWSFSSSNDNILWRETGPMNYAMSNNQTLYVPYHTSFPYRCFRIECIESTNQNSYPHIFDVKAFDLYGYIVPLQISHSHFVFLSFPFRYFIYQTLSIPFQTM